MADKDFQNMRLALWQTMHAPKPVARFSRMWLAILLAVVLWLAIAGSCFVLVRLAGG